jgi:hypothetical protein
MAGASAEGEQNPWPAFVDVLTTVIMVVTFMLVIMSAAIMQLSSKVVEDMRQSISAEKMAEKDAELSRIRYELETLRAQEGKSGGAAAEALRASELTRVDPVEGDLRRAVVSKEMKTDAQYRIESPEDTANEGGAIVQSADVLLTLQFNEDVIRLEEAVEKQAIDVIKREGAGVSARYEVWSTAIVNGSVSDARRSAYYRALVARNILIHAGVPSANVSAQVRVVDRDPKGNNVRIIVKP